ncbi:transcriptional regulator [Methylocucumis oryzae]|uniref:Transcriptional regulator n=2 Tax=Methylocucumis oryzae TaxID=1632867 RepID=A0A0F3ILF9_9GAMM|nr:transcriptional regulator [Methylocucumis oryzae]
MSNMNDDSARYLISTVSKRSGVKSDLVRAWERRYQAVTPTRTTGGHRVYSDLDIARLKLLNQATNKGHSISQIAQYSIDELKNLLKDGTETEAEPLLPKLSNNETANIAERYIEKCYAAVLAFDARALELHFENALVELGTEVFIEHLLTPLLTIIGERWRIGELRPVHEHMASAIIRSLTYILRNNNPAPKGACRMVVSTPIGQLHELGALLAAIIAELKGWQVTYLGANLPAEEIAAAVKYTHATAVTISISFADDDLLLHKEIRKLKKLLGNDVSLIVGGRAAGHYQPLLNEVGVINIENYDHFRHILMDLEANKTNQDNAKQ